MLDVSRHFFPATDVIHILNLMATYKLNTLHLHLTDDEGWRLAIPGLDELTEVRMVRVLCRNGVRVGYFPGTPADTPSTCGGDIIGYM